MRNRSPHLISIFEISLYKDLGALTMASFCKWWRWNFHSALIGWFLAVTFCQSVSICGLGSALSANDIVVVVLDDSGSMKENMKTDRGQMSRMDAAKLALETVIDTLDDETQLGLLLLNGARPTEHWLIPLGKLEKRSAKAKIESIRAHDGTPLGAAMRTGVTELLEVRAKQIYGHYRLLVVTDGEATDADLLAKVFPDLVSRGISIDVIGVDMKADHSLSTRAHSYRRASDAESFKKAVQEVFAETGSDNGVADFDMIGQLSEELARESLAALTLVNNEPVKETEFVPSSPQNFGVPTSKSSPGSYFGGTICCLGAFFVLILIGIGSAKRKRR